jgi:hypothetical protein
MTTWTLCGSRPVMFITRLSHYDSLFELPIMCVEAGRYARVTFHWLTTKRVSLWPSSCVPTYTIVPDLRWAVLQPREGSTVVSASFIVTMIPSSREMAKARRIIEGSFLMLCPYGVFITAGSTWTSATAILSAVKCVSHVT